MNKFLIGLLLLGVVMSQASNPQSGDAEDAFWQAGAAGPWNNATIEPGMGLQSDDAATDQASCEDDSDYTWIAGSNSWVLNQPGSSPAPQNDISGQCWQIAEAQTCYDALGLLDDIGYDGSNIDGDLINHCLVREESGEKFYDFLLTWRADYVHIDNCVRQEINFINHDPASTYVPGTSDVDDDVRPRTPVPAATNDIGTGEKPHDQWWYNPVTSQITFTVDHEDLQSEYGCHYQETTTDLGDGTQSEVYQWICDLELNVYFSGEIQFTYEFQMISTLDRTVSDTLDVAVQRNVVVGNCCENTLDVSSSLFFCTDLYCNNGTEFEDENSTGWIDTTGNGNADTKEVERKQVFYVAHRIDTAEFQDYWLQPISLHIGPFVPKIWNWVQFGHTVTNTSRGSTNVLVYEVESYVALDKMTITSVALLDDRSGDVVDTDNFGASDQPQGYGGVDFNSSTWAITDADDSRRRVLEEVGEDYKIKAEGEMSVGEPKPESDNGNKKSSDSEDSSIILSFGCALFLVLALF